MSNPTIKRIDTAHAPRGDMGQRYLASGVRVGLRLWDERSQSVGEDKPRRCRDYETVGYVLEGKAELQLEGDTVTLGPGDSWVVPADVAHSYRILEPFRAVEATAPPAHVRSRDEPARPQGSSHGVTVTGH